MLRRLITFAMAGGYYWSSESEMGVGMSERELLELDRANGSVGES